MDFRKFVVLLPVGLVLFSAIIHSSRFSDKINGASLNGKKTSRGEQSLLKMFHSLASTATMLNV